MTASAGGGGQFA
jgi:hypothetical protein